jgi:hypothetical protein
LWTATSAGERSADMAVGLSSRQDTFVWPLLPTPPGVGTRKTAAQLIWFELLWMADKMALVAAGEDVVIRLARPGEQGREDQDNVARYSCRDAHTC